MDYINLCIQEGKSFSRVFGIQNLLIVALLDVLALESLVVVNAMHIAVTDEAVECTGVIVSGRTMSRQWARVSLAS